MIAVDIFADLYGWDDQNRARSHRALGAAKVLYGVARRRAAPVAGPAIFVDAALSVLDAIGAYARYRQAQEITNQLEIEGNMFRQMLAELHKQLQIELRVVDFQFGAELEALRMRLKQQKLAIEFDEEKFNALCQQVKKLGRVISSQRMNAPPNCAALLHLENAYYQLVDLQLQTAMSFVKE